MHQATREKLRRFGVGSRGRFQRKRNTRKIMQISIRVLSYRNPFVCMVYFPKGSTSLYGIYLGLQIGIWESPWALSIYHIPTWTLWVYPAPYAIETLASLRALKPRSQNLFEPHLEGQGDLVSSLIIGTIGVTILL